MEKKTRASLAYKSLREIPREFLNRLRETQVDELDLSHNELTYPFYVPDISLTLALALAVTINHLKYCYGVVIK